MASDVHERYSPLYQATVQPNFLLFLDDIVAAFRLEGRLKNQTTKNATNINGEVWVAMQDTL